MVYQNGKTVAISQASASSGLSQDIYSTEEQVIGRWIDGKPLYRKVVSITLPSSSGWTYFGVLDKSLEHVVSINGTLYYYAEDEWSSVTNTLLGGMPNGPAVKRGIVSYYNTNSDYFGSQVILFFEYTKTTDESTITLNPIQQDSAFHLNLQDTPLPTVMPVTATLVEE